ncbi:MAG: lmo0937 family membrane protein [Myxococcaceae bacterium]
MFWTIAVILMVLWVLGMVAGSTVGAWVHLLLVAALVSLVLAVAGQGRAAVR